MHTLKYFYTFFCFLPFIFFIKCSDGPQIDREIEDNKFPNDWFFNQRAYPTGKINYDKYYQSIKYIKELKGQAKGASFWEFAGPENIGGRLSDVEVHPENTAIIFAGTASGGIFKSNDSGSSWTPVFDDALSLSIGDIAIASSNFEIIYSGTGEANAGGGSQTYEGNGVYKSTDSGDNWSYAGLAKSRNIGRLAIHPVNPDIVYVAAMGSLFADSPDRGIYKTINGGIHWEQVLFVSDSTGGIDIVVNPASPEIVYAAMWERVRRPDRRSYGGPTSGIYRSTDSGLSWSKLINGLPSGIDIGRIGISISASNPETVYAIYADKTGYFNGVFKTTNGGESWVQTNDGSLNACYQSYGWWFGRIKIDPVDPDIAYVIGFDLYKTSNGGSSWSNISSGTVHVDQHEIYIDPLNHNHLFLGSDGGLYTSLNGGNTWTWVNNLPITQFYTCEIDQQHPDRIYGGTQDNGTNRTLTGAVDDWQNIYGGDGFYVLVNPENTNYIYAEYQYGNLARSTNGGSSFSMAMNGISSSDRKNWNTPVVFGPANPAVLYYGSNKLYRSANHAGNWTAISNDLTNGPGGNLTYGTITSISVSPIDDDLIYVGTDDGNVWVTTQGGLEWEHISSELPDRWVTRVVADPNEEDRVYVTFSGYRWDEFLPHVFRSDNKGEIWTDISSDLPELPVNDLIVDPANNEILYLATDAGVFVSYVAGNAWELLGSNFPVVPVTDLDLHNPDRKLLAATYGRSMYSYDLYQDTVQTKITENISNDKYKVSLYPNPWLHNLTISFYTQNKEIVKLDLFDLAGNKIFSINNMNFPKGKNSFTVNSERITLKGGGTYIIRLTFGEHLVYKKVIYTAS